jgi:hypothetical protein
METFTKRVHCVVCDQDGTAVYRVVSPTASRLLSLDCPGGCWKTPGAQALLQQLNVAPVADRLPRPDMREPRWGERG